MTSKKKRQRGSHTHGGGSKKNRRGAGNRGGRGNAGSGKRADQKKPSYWKEEQEKGFTSLKQKKGKPDVINISDLNERLETLKEEGLVEKSGGAYEVDLEELGYGKLLGGGEPKEEFEIKVAKASDSAVDKVEEAGGSVQLTEE